MDDSKNIGWILHNSCTDVCYTNTIPLLTDDELLHCIRHESRGTGLRRLKAEARRRGLKVGDESGH